MIFMEKWVCRCESCFVREMSVLMIFIEEIRADITYLMERLKFKNIYDFY